MLPSPLRHTTCSIVTVVAAKNFKSLLSHLIASGAATGKQGFCAELLTQLGSAPCDNPSTNHIHIYLAAPLLPDWRACLPAGLLSFFYKKAAPTLQPI